MSNANVAPSFFPPVITFLYEWRMHCATNQLLKNILLTKFNVPLFEFTYQQMPDTVFLFRANHLMPNLGDPFRHILGRALIRR